MLPSPAMKRLEHFGYGTPTDTLNRIAARIMSLPGVENSPVTKSAIDIILRMELNPNADPMDIPESAHETGHDRRAYGERTVTDLPGI